MRAWPEELSRPEIEAAGAKDRERAVGATWGRQSLAAAFPQPRCSARVRAPREPPTECPLATAPAALRHCLLRDHVRPGCLELHTSDPDNPWRQRPRGPRPKRELAVHLYRRAGV